MEYVISIIAIAILIWCNVIKRKIDNCYPSCDVRDRLIELGIPRRKHSLSEISFLLPDGTRTIKDTINGKIDYIVNNINGLTDVNAQGETEVEAKAKFIIYLKKNNLI